MKKSIQLDGVLRDAIGDTQVLERLLERPQDIESLYDFLPSEERNLLIQFFRQINLQIDERVRGEAGAFHRVMEVFNSSQRAFNDMRLMNWIIFFVGIALVAVSVWLGITGQREVYVLLFGGMGIVSLVTYLLVRPMQGVRSALSDFLQAHITFDTANQQIGAWHPKNFTPHNIEEVQQVSDALQGIRESSVRLLQRTLEEKKLQEEKKRE